FKKENGAEPHGMVVLDSTGTRLLGMTRRGGTPPEGTGAGVIFSYDLQSDVYEVLHSFVANSQADGDTNAHGFLTSASGVASGVTEVGGEHLQGTLFRIEEDGSGFAIVHSFGAAGDGAQPFGSLVQLGDFLYGTTTIGGAYGDGTVFRFRPSDGVY